MAGRITGNNIGDAGFGRIGRLFLVILPIFFCLLFLGVDVKKAEAAGAAISITTKNPAPTVGDEVYVVITVKSSELIKGFEGYFSYDNRVLQFVTGGSVIHGNDDEFQIDDTKRTVSATKITYSVKFLARGRGSTSITLKKGVEVTADNDDSSKMSISYSPLNIVVNKKGASASDTAKPDGTEAPEETEMPEAADSPSPSEAPASSSPRPTPGKNDIAGSNKLRKLSIGDGVLLAPDFSPKIKNYSAIVTTDDTKLPVTYEAEDSQAEIKVKGNKKLTEGKNTIKIAVTGTNGKKRVYSISVTIQRITGSNSKNSANRLAVLEKGGKTYLTGSTTVQLLEPGKGVIPSGFAEIEIELDGKTITAYALEGSKESSFVLLYGKGNEKGLYLYDKKENILMPYEKVKSWYRSLDGKAVFEMTAQEKTIQSMKYVVGIMAAFCGLMALFAVAALLRSRR